MGSGQETKSAQRRPRLMYLLSLAYRRLQSAARSEVEGATPARAGLLMALSANGNPVGLKHVQSELGLGPSALSGLVDRMEREGLVVRLPDPGDGRAWNLKLTSDGIRMRADAKRISARLAGQLEDGFSEQELAIVVRWLESTIGKFAKEKGR